eukprot:1816926-Amphidinium_carterae.1
MTELAGREHINRSSLKHELAQNSAHHLLRVCHPGLNVMHNSSWDSELQVTCGLLTDRIWDDRRAEQSAVLACQAAQRACNYWPVAKASGAIRSCCSFQCNSVQFWTYCLKLIGWSSICKETDYKQISGHHKPTKR